MDAKEALLKASGPIFADKGFEGSTVKDIAKSAGVNVALIYYHFSDKEGLYKALLESIGLERIAVVERMLHPAANQEEFRVRLKLFIEEFLLFHLSHPYVMRIVHRDFDGGQPIVMKIFKDVFVQTFTRLKLFFDAAQKSGIIRQDVSADSASSMICGGIMNSARLDTVRREAIGFSLHDPAYAAEFVNQYVNNFCYGAFPRSEK